MEVILQSPITLVLVVGVCIWLGISVYERYTVERDVTARRQAIEAEKAALQVRKELLETRVDELQGERGVEAEIRKNFDVTREGEQVVIILDDVVEAEPTPPPAVVEKPWYQFW